MSNEEESDFTYNVIKSAGDLMEDGNIYKGLFGAAIYAILDDIDHDIIVKIFIKSYFDGSIGWEYKLIHEFYTHWRNSSTG